MQKDWALVLLWSSKLDQIQAITNYNFFDKYLINFQVDDLSNIFNNEMNIRERPDQPVRVKITVMVKGAVVFSRAYDEDSAKEGGKLHDFFSSVKVFIKCTYLNYITLELVPQAGKVI